MNLAGAKIARIRQTAKFLRFIVENFSPRISFSPLFTYIYIRNGLCFRLPTCPESRKLHRRQRKRFGSARSAKHPPMKTTRILAAALLAAASTACTEHPVKPRFTATVLDTLLVRPSYNCQVGYRFATIANARKSEALQAIEQSNIIYFFELEEFDGTAAEAMNESLRQLDEELRLPATMPPSVARMECEVSVESEGSVVDTLLCYMIYRSSYLGGAHGMYSTEYHTYSLADGYELSAADLLGEEKMEPLQALIRAKLCQSCNAANDEELSAAGFFPDYISVTDNFRITPEGMIFHYNPYEIACYANGEIDVEVSREELEAL